MNNKSNLQRVVTLAFVTFVAGMAVPEATAQWGTIKGRFVVDGSVPSLMEITPTKDAFCIAEKPVNERVIVGDGGGLANVVVFIRLGRNDTIDAHPDYAGTLSERSELDNKGCAFLPHITLVRAGQPFVLKNSDPTGHNTNAKLQKNGAFNIIIPAGEKREMTFDRGESLPMPVNCNIHPFMEGHILIQDHPYMVVSGEDGTFEIANIPAGEHEFQFWHEANGYLKDTPYTGGKLDRRGRVELTIPADGTLDLGDISVPANLLQ